MTNQGKSKDDEGQDGNLTELHEDVVRRLYGVLDTVANRFFEPKLHKLQEVIDIGVEVQANALRKLRNEHKERLDALNILQATHFSQTEEYLGQLAVRCDEAKGSLEHLNAEIDGQARALMNLHSGHKERLDAAEEAQKKVERQLDALNILQATQFNQTAEKLGQLAARCDRAQGSLDHLNSEVNRLEAIIQQQASTTEAAIARLNARMVITRRLIWLLATALVASFFLILKKS